MSEDNNASTASISSSNSKEPTTDGHLPSGKCLCIRCGHSWEEIWEAVKGCPNCGTQTLPRWLTNDMWWHMKECFEKELGIESYREMSRRMAAMLERVSDNWHVGQNMPTRQEIETLLHDRREQILQGCE